MKRVVPAKRRKESGDWGIFGVNRDNVKKIRRKQTLETLKRRKEERGLEAKTELEKKRSEYYTAKASRKAAQKKASFHWPVPPIPLITGPKKKKQGKRLSSKSRIRLI